VVSAQPFTTAAPDPFARLAAMSAAWDAMADATLRGNDAAFSAAKARFDAAKQQAFWARRDAAQGGL